VSTFAGLVGSGAGIVVIALALIISAHYHHAPSMTHPWIERLVIVLMYAGGSTLAVTQLGAWSDDAIRLVAGWFGGLDAGIPRTALVVTALFLIAGTVIALIFAPSTATGIVAAMIPLVLSLVAGGALHQLYVSTSVPAQAFAANLNAWIAG
jgi:hypothetical protein